MKAAKTKTATNARRAILQRRNAAMTTNISRIAAVRRKHVPPRMNAITKATLITNANRAPRAKSAIVRTARKPTDAAIA